MKGSSVFEGNTPLDVKEVEEELVPEADKDDSDKVKQLSISDFVEIEETFKDNALVIRVIDADTIEINLNGYVIDVRLLLVDAPETVHPDIPAEQFGAEAVHFARQTLLGKQVQLEYDGPRYDDYGRLLAYVWIDGKMFNQMLLEEGLAHVAYAYAPPYKYYDRFMVAQVRAREEGKGIWKVNENYGFGP